MNKKIERLKTELREAYKEESSDETVKVTLTLNSYGFFTQTEERSLDSLKDQGVNMRNLKGDWIK